MSANNEELKLGSPENKTGKIVLLCGTSTAGKTSICGALQDLTGNSWFINGADIAVEKAWNEPSVSSGKEYKPASEHFTEAMKKYAGKDLVESAIGNFDPRTLSVAILSRKDHLSQEDGELEKTTFALGNPKVDIVTIHAGGDITSQCKKIHSELSDENQVKYSLENIRDLLKIISKCPETQVFLASDPHPIQNLNGQMLEDAIMMAKKGQSVILDVVGNEMLGELSMSSQFHSKITEAGLPLNTGSIEVVHCPIEILIDRMDERNRKALEAKKPEDVRKAFFPYNQYGEIYEKAPSTPEPQRPVVGIVHKKDIIAAAEKFGRKEDSLPLLKKLGFSEKDETIEVVTRIPCDQVLQNIKLQDTQDIARDIRKRVFSPTPQVKVPQQSTDSSSDFKSFRGRYRQTTNLEGKDDSNHELVESTLNKGSPK